MDMPGWPVKTWPPHFLHHLRSLFFVRLEVPMLSAPRVTWTAAGGLRLKALSGDADHSRHDSQWQ